VLLNLLHYKNGREKREFARLNYFWLLFVSSKRWKSTKNRNKRSFLPFLLEGFFTCSSIHAWVNSVKESIVSLTFHAVKSCIDVSPQKSQFFFLEIWKFFLAEQKYISHLSLLSKWYQENVVVETRSWIGAFFITDALMCWIHLLLPHWIIFIMSRLKKCPEPEIVGHFRHGERTNEASSSSSSHLNCACFCFI